MYRKFYKSSFEIFFIFCLIFKLFIFQISICRKQLQRYIYQTKTCMICDRNGGQTEHAELCLYCLITWEIIITSCHKSCLPFWPRNVTFQDRLSLERLLNYTYIDNDELWYFKSVSEKRVSSLDMFHCTVLCQMDCYIF